MTDGNHAVQDHAQNGATDAMSQADAPKDDATLQIICLGSGGGPSEDNVSGFLARSVGTGWARSSVLAVDAGSHLAAIARVMEKHFPLYSSGQSAHASISTEPERKQPTVLKDGPFAGIKLPHESARANALHLLHTYVSTYLITHPHLDHLSGFAINTAALHGRSRPKTLAALPDTVDAVKRHIFNDIIWPNLTDEDGGVGFVTFQRLKEGGDPMVGEGDSRGYIDVCDGISVKAFSISHGVCTKSPPAHQHRGSITQADFAAIMNESAPQDHTMSRSLYDHGSAPDTPSSNRRHSLANFLQQPPFSPARCVVDSTAYFLRDEDSGREVLIFGDVEPDSISLMPRNEVVWAEAARKVAHGTLRGVLIECSYTDATPDEALFGHLSPRHVIAELQVLAQMVHDVKTSAHLDMSATRKRKRSHHIDSTDSSRRVSNDEGRKRKSSVHGLTAADPSAVDPYRHPHDSMSQIRSEPAEALSPRALAAKHMSALRPLSRSGQYSKRSSISAINWDESPLKDLTVIIMHVKDTFKDGPPVSEIISAQLEAYEHDLALEGHGLGCKFIMSQPGESYWF